MIGLVKFPQRGQDPKLVSDHEIFISTSYLPHWGAFPCAGRAFEAAQERLDLSPLWGTFSHRDGLNLSARRPN